MKKLFLILGVGLLVAAMAAPAMASEWSFYGSVRMKFFSTDVEDGAGNSDRNTTYQGQSNSRIGAKAKGGNIHGYVELGSQNNGQTTNTDIYTRKLYGTWDFGPGVLKIGKDYSMDYTGTGSSGLIGGDDVSFAGNGSMYTGRRNYIALTIGGLDLSVKETSLAGGSAIPTRATLNGPAGYTPQVSIPMLGARYTYKMDPLTLMFAGTYLSYDLENPGKPDLSVDCYAGEVGAKLMFGPLRLQGSAYYAQNQEQMGFSGSNLIAGNDGARVDIFNNVIDNDTIGYALVANYKVNNMLDIQAGYAYMSSEFDKSNTEKDDDQTYYLQAVVEVSPGFYIVPEIGVNDQKQSGSFDTTVTPSVDEGKNTYVGAKFQMDF